MSRGAEVLFLMNPKTVVNNIRRVCNQEGGWNPRAVRQAERLVEHAINVHVREAREVTVEEQIIKIMREGTPHPTHMAMSRILGVARETVSRTMSRMADEGTLVRTMPVPCRRYKLGSHL